MSRIDLPELEDQAWCPAWIRDAITGYLQAVIEATQPYDVAAPVVARLLDETGASAVVDLASGAGGPWRTLLARLEELGHRPTVTLTDVAPNAVAAGRFATGAIRYRAAPMSALDVPPDLRGVRTMFTALHHFDRDQVRTILQSAQRDRVGFAAFEATRRSVPGLLVTLFIPLLVLVFMPRVTPRRFLPLLFTYLPPLLPLLIWWDGLASTLRSYSLDELRTVIDGIREPGYAWEVSDVAASRGPIPLLQVTGRPVPPS